MRRSPRKYEERKWMGLDQSLSLKKRNQAAGALQREGEETDWGSEGGEDDESKSATHLNIEWL